jgi:hypothetical protein
MSPTWEVDNPGVKETSSCATPSGWSTQLRIWFPDVPRPTAISRAIWAGFCWVKSVYTLPKESTVTRKCVPLIANTALASPQLRGTCSNLLGKPTLVS